MDAHGVRPVVHREHAPQPVEALVEASGRPPQLRRRLDDQPGQQLRTVRGERELGRLPDVRQLDLGVPEPLALAGTHPVGLQLRADVGVPAGVCLAHLLLDAADPQLLAAVLAQDDQHPIAGRPLRRRRQDRPGDERLDELDRLAVGHLPQHRGRRRQIEAAGEHRQRLPGQPLLGVAELVAPGDRVAQRALGRRRPPGRRRQGPQRLGQDGVQLRQAEHPDPRRRQLDRERQPVDAPADQPDGLAGRGAVVENRRRRPGAVAEEREGVRAGLGPGVLERAEDDQLLTGDAEFGPRRGEHVQPGAGVQDGQHQFGHRLAEVLAVVERDERGPGAQLPGELARHVQPAGRDAERGQQARPHQRACADGCEVDEGRAPAEGRARRVRDLDGEPGLADPGWADDRDQRMGFDARASDREFLGSPDERGQGSREHRITSQPMGQEPETARGFTEYSSTPNDPRAVSAKGRR